ncbi:MAG: methyltransferase [Bifidobacteriaceae bacterium]|nr:methyltransferase [Bifidobacteriaceae bacterium]
MPHYFEPGDPISPDGLEEFDVSLAGQPARVASAPGVFSARRLDPGTAVLLRFEARDGGAPPGRGDLVDLGCGWGPIALTLARLAPEARVWAVDVNRRALALTALNAERLGLGNVSAVSPDAIPPDLEVDLLWSNPPIRVGKQALRQLLRHWLGRLRPGAHADLVAQKHLGADSLIGWLSAQPDWSAAKQASAKGYRVIRVARAEAAAPGQAPQDEASRFGPK